MKKNFTIFAMTILMAFSAVVLPFVASAEDTASESNKTESSSQENTQPDTQQPAGPQINQSSSDSTARYQLPFDMNVASYILVSLDTGEVIFEKNSHEKRTPASLTKLLTSYVAMKYTEDLDGTMITAKQKDFDEIYGYNSSTADIRKDETLSMRQLLYAMLLPSANEAGCMVANHIGKGSRSNFCMLMNTEAKKLGATDTNFTNAHGLFTDNHYTSAYDMYLIAKACYETPGFMDIATTSLYQMPANTRHAQPYNIISTIKMQSKGSPFYRSYVKGMKTGSLPEAGHNFVSVCQKNGESYILVVMGAFADGNLLTSNFPAFDATSAIMDYFFNEFSLKPANSLESPVSEVKLKYAKGVDNLLVYPKSEVYSVLPNSAEENSFQKIFNLPKEVSAPVKAGDTIGTVSYYIADSLVGTTELICAESYDRDFIIFLVEKFKEGLHSLYFRVVVIVTLVLIIAFIIFQIYLGKKYEKMQKIHRRTK